jgi:cardiolipin synthase A/B
MRIPTKSVVKRTALWGAGVVVLLFALIGATSLLRGTPLRSVIALGDRDGVPPAVTDSLFGRTMQLLADVNVESGNAVELMLNGEGTYPQLWRDLRSATRTITVQMYYSQPGAVADTLAAVLKERSRARVRVLLLFDAFGSQNLLDQDGYVRGLREAGVEVAILRPLHWYSLHKANFRSHARVVVVDGRVAYTGGFGVADYWLGNGRQAEQWRETNVRFQGRAVSQLQAAFAAAWVEATGALIIGDAFFPPASFTSPGGTWAALLYAIPTTGSTNGERFMALSIASARRTYYAANSYFVPDDDFRRLLIAAAKRGVDVRILTAGDQTDVKTTMYAGRYRYRELLESGIRIYEYQPTMMHAKTFVVDGFWSTVGSLNYDNRSIAFNNETNLVVLDSAFGAAMDAEFLKDLEFATEITLEAHRRRPVTQKVMAWGANLLSRVL